MEALHRLWRRVRLLAKRRAVEAAMDDEMRYHIERATSELEASGVPVEGEAGVGYRLRGFEMPPLMFTRDEVEALVLGARIVQSWTDPSLARAATEALAKIEGALPQDRSHLV